jgi:uncharacterized phiE125 gp8 family phage protein
MGLVLITPPDSDPISLTEAKEHLRVDFDDEDSSIAAMIKAATLAIQNRCDRTLMPTTWDLVLDAWPTCPEYIRLPRPPLISVESVNYVDPDGMEVELDQSEYEVDTSSLHGWVVPVSTSGWPSIKETINAVRVRFVAGYALTDDSPPEVGVPEPIRMAIKLMLSDFYEQRGSVVVGTSVSSIPNAVRALLLDYELITV